MVDLNPIEIEAMEHASQSGGQFIERQPSTDMATWSAQQWQQFVACTVGGYVDHLLARQVQAQDAAHKVQT